MTACVIQRGVFRDEQHLRPLYYRLSRPRACPPPPAVSDRFALAVGRGSTLSTDTYFNSFFESYWRHYTRLGRLRLRLRLRLTGAGSVVLRRRSPVTGVTVVASADFDGGEEVVLDVPDPGPHPRESGALHFRLTARSAVLLHRAEWLAEGVQPNPVALVAGYCTFNREPFVLHNVAALLDDPAVAAVLRRVVVVDQGTRKVRNHPDFPRLPGAAGHRLLLVEQGNFGGAGGFTRVMLEARADPGATHVLLMDDDAELEPESVFRAAAFLSLAREEVAVGGPMLDMLRPLDVHTAGSLVHARTLTVRSPVHQHSVRTPAGLHPFLRLAYTHYNAWWFFACPLRVIDRVGLPLPLFLRGDDAEFGCRLLAAGIPTATVPGFSVWHEPLDVKEGDWQPYYNLRNLLVLTALHSPLRRGRLLVQLLRRLVSALLVHDYGKATLFCEAVEDFRRGPRVIESDPRRVHDKLLAIQRRLQDQTLPLRASLLVPRRAPCPPPGWRRPLLMARCLWHQLTRRSPRAGAPPEEAFRGGDAGWWSVGMGDVAAVEDWYADRYRIVRRSRKHFVRLLARGVTAAVRLCCRHERVGAAWRAAVGRLTSEAFWHDYLGTGLAAGGRDPRAAA
jgi:galactofuranosylgalactofuranosylrhamnosyl-N-acetylglucosaminyl-diphospho-decaprenol beta-1,5/1,6-galactofuranosyltransferase